MKVTKINYSEIVEKGNNVLKNIGDVSSFQIDSDIDLLKEKIHSFKKAADTLVDQSKLLRIGIVGQVKAGKSSFLNALFFEGKEVLPKASTPMTAGLVIIEYADSNHFEIEYYNREDWKVFERENQYYKEKFDEFKQYEPNYSNSEIHDNIKKDFPELAASHELFEGINLHARTKIGGVNEIVAFSKIDELQGKFQTYVGAGGDYTSVVKSITLRLNYNKLKDIQIVDTPGVNDPVISRERKTKEMLKTCHGVFLLSSATQFFSQEDESFLSDRIGTEGIQEVVVIASKYDSALSDVGHNYKNDLEGAINEVQSSIKKQWDNKVKINPKLAKIKFDLVSTYMYNLSLFDDYSNVKEDELAHKYNWFKKTFSDYFSDDKQVKELFTKLSNFENLHTKYIESEFLNRKEEIISQKIESFFESNAKNIGESIQKLNNILQSKLDLLTTQDLSQLKRTKQDLENNTHKLVEEFNKPIKTFVESFKENQIKHINKLGEDLLKVNALKPNSKKVKINTLIKKNKLWFRKTRDIRYDYPFIDFSDYVKEINKIKESLIENIVYFNNDDYFNVSVKKLKSELIHILDKILINKSTLDVYENNGIIEEKIKQFIEKYFSLSDTDAEQKTNEIFEQFFNDSIFDYSVISGINKGKVEKREDEVESSIKKKAGEINNKITKFYNTTKTAAMSAVQGFFIGEKLHKIDKSTTDLTKEAITHIKSIFTEDIKMLEATIHNKEQAIEELEATIEKIQQIKSLYV